MIITVISDLHDNVANWKIIWTMLLQQEIHILINCGDTIAPDMLKEMSKTFIGHIYTVFGNNADRKLETEVVKSLSNVTHYVDHGDVTIAGRRISLNHYPEVADQDAGTGNFDLICHGHTHLKRWEKVGKSYILNPGTAGGMFQYPSFAVVDLAAMSHQFIEVKI